MYTTFDKSREVIGICGRHVYLCDIAAQHFAGNGVEQQARCSEGVVGVFLDQCAGSQNGSLVNLLHRYAVVQVAHGFGHDWVRFDICT